MVCLVRLYFPVIPLSTPEVQGSKRIFRQMPMTHQSTVLCVSRFRVLFRHWRPIWWRVSWEDIPASVRPGCGAFQKPEAMRLVKLPGFLQGFSVKFCRKPRRLGLKAGKKKSRQVQMSWWNVGGVLNIGASNIQIFLYLMHHEALVLFEVGNRQGDVTWCQHRFCCFRMPWNIHGFASMSLLYLWISARWGLTEGGRWLMHVAFPCRLAARWWFVWYQKHSKTTR